MFDQFGVDGWGGSLSVGAAQDWMDEILWTRRWICGARYAQTSARVEDCRQVVGLFADFVGFLARCSGGFARNLCAAAGL